MSNPAMSFIAEGAAATTSGFTHEDIMNLVLITIPTIILAIVTIWDNDHMYKITLKALDKLRPSHRRLVTRVSRHARHLRTKKEPSWREVEQQSQGNVTKASVGSNFLTKSDRVTDESTTAESEPRQLEMDPVPATTTRE